MTDHQIPNDMQAQLSEAGAMIGPTSWSLWAKLVKRWGITDVVVEVEALHQDTHQRVSANDASEALDGE